MTSPCWLVEVANTLFDESQCDGSKGCRPEIRTSRTEGVESHHLDVGRWDDRPAIGPLGNHFEKEL